MSYVLSNEETTNKIKNFLPPILPHSCHSTTHLCFFGQVKNFIEPPVTFEGSSTVLKRKATLGRFDFSGRPAY